MDGRGRVWCAYTESPYSVARQATHPLCPVRLSNCAHVQINDILEASLGQLQARNHPHAEAVAAALNRTGSTERRSALLLTPSSPLRQKALQTAHASKAVATAGPLLIQSFPEHLLAGEP